MAQTGIAYIQINQTLARTLDQRLNALDGIDEFTERNFLVFRPKYLDWAKDLV
jgi:hypothetical protein